MASPSTPEESKSAKLLRELFAAGRPLLYILSAEERRVGNLLRQAGRRSLDRPIPYWSWSLTEGMKGEGAAGADTTDPRRALDFIASHEGPGVFHLKDFHEPMREAVVVRRLRDLYDLCMGQGKYVVVSSPVRFIPDELSRNLVFIELNVPDFVEVRQFLAEQAAALKAAGVAVDTSESTLVHMARALQGLTLDEAGFAVRRAVAETKRLGLESLPVLFDEKKMLVNRSGTIQYVADGAQIDRVGGLEVMKKWLQERRALFQQRDTIGAEMVPKGVLVMGVSAAARACR